MNHKARMLYVRVAYALLVLASLIAAGIGEFKWG
jgi:hypothetical protein